MNIRCFAVVALMSTVSAKSPTQVTIASDVAHFVRSKTNGRIATEYRGHVRIVFDDIATVRCTALTTTLFYTGKTAMQSMVHEPIHLTGSVQIEAATVQAQADEAMCDLTTQICFLQGNVVVEQKNKTDPMAKAPMIMRSSHVTIDLQRGAVQAEGNADQPVTTVIALDDLQAQQKSKKVVQ